MERVACIDIGTVTVRLAVADVEDAQVLRLIKRSTICDLGGGSLCLGPHLRRRARSCHGLC